MENEISAVDVDRKEVPRAPMSNVDTHSRTGQLSALNLQIRPSSKKNY
jgi:hypothetical protein